ncbi:hypothetical protein H6H03_06260 [Nostoc paludosum FACHB-159]|uniref:Transposase n=1 Tax=Nostoc paludosum FACHB-159 TaxID=2692908 RepID=A0ABR8K266_9NOSO|nr:hypothetical protein [Nostoc sp. FACHB-857]MBD2733517.1 hypothetical protein [Nostoc paludosum FACHB-159]
MTTARQVLEQSVVMFYQNYLPLCRINIKRAIVLLVTKQTTALGFTTESEWQIHSLQLRADVESSSS